MARFLAGLNGIRFSIVGWAGVALDALLLIHGRWPDTSLLGVVAPLAAYRRAIDAGAFALLLVGLLLEGAGHLWANLARLSAPPAEEGELRWPQFNSGLRRADWFGRALMVYGGALPAIFVAAAVLLFLLAPARQFLFFVAIVALFPARRLGHWLALRWLSHARPYTVSLSARGMASPLPFVPWEGLSCYEVGPAQGRFLVFGRPFPRPPLIVLEAPPALAGPVHAALRAHLPEATAAESVAWRRNEAAWVAQLSVPFLAACAAVASAFLLADRNLACAGLALTFLLCERWFEGFAGRIMGLSPAPRLPEVALGEGAVSPGSPAPSSVHRTVSRLATASLALGLAGWVYMDHGPVWRYGSYLALVSDVFVAVGFVLALLEIKMSRRE